MTPQSRGCKQTTYTSHAATDVFCLEYTVFCFAFIFKLN